MDKIIQSPAEQHSLVMRHIYNYHTYIHIYADGSVTGGKTGSAAIIPSQEYFRAVRLTEGVGSYTSELYALNLAVDGISSLFMVGRYQPLQSSPTA